MTKSYRRFEILLPLTFNDEQPVPDELISETLLELRARFGAISSETQTIQGTWSHLGQVYRDELFRVFVDVPDTAASREFFVAFKESLKQRFGQLDLWITSYAIEVI
jgi:hypothetical protein